MAPLSIEEENYVRLALLLKGVTPRAVRTYFDVEFPPNTLSSTLSTSYNTLLDLKIKRIINQAQWNLLIPRNGVPDSKTFDVTLMICLIRNLISISPPINGFDTLPLPGEITPGSDLARIKCYRNKLAHHDSNKIDTAFSNTAWREISDAVFRLGGQTMYQECQELKVKILDQSNQEILLEIKHSLDEMKELRQTINNLGMEHSKVTKSIIQLETSYSSLQTEHFTVTENLKDLQTSHGNLQISHSKLQTSYSILQTDHSTLTDKLEDLQTSTSSLQTSHSTLQTEHLNVMESLKDPIPWNIREQIEKQIKDWECKDKMFVPTRASDYVMECLQYNSCVTLTAPSGVGKSFIARHTALLLKREGYRIIPVYTPTDIRTYYQSGKQTIFIVDDICGNFIADQYQIGNWKQLLPVINTLIADKYCKIIVSCRLQVYKDDRFNILLPFKSCECNLVSNKLCLTYVEKNAIAKSYIGSSLYDIDTLSQKFDFFPLLCSLYKGGNNGDVKEFFKNPFNVYQNELDNLSRHGDEGILRICSLALCVIFDNQLEVEWFQGKLTNEQKHIIEDICDACEINRITSKTKLNKALDTLDGTFICKQNGIYKTVHDKLFDFLAHYFGQKMIGCLIDHGDSDLVRDRFVWEKSLDNKKSNIDFIIKIPDEYLESYLERFIKDWSAGMVSDVLSNINMEDLSFRQQLLQYLQQLDNLEQVALVNTKDTVRPKESCASGNTPLILTCYYGYIDMVQWLLHNDADVDQCRDDGNTGLVMASQNGRTDIVKLLLEKDPNVDLCDHDGYSPLCWASQEGHTDIVTLLLEKNPNIDLCDKDSVTPLCWASFGGHTDIVFVLLEKNPNVDLCDKDDVSPLCWASYNGHADIVKLLLERNPNVDLCNKEGFTPLITACIRNNTSMVQLLMKHKPNINAQTYDGGNPLLFSALNGNLEITRLLLKNNADCNICCCSKQFIIDTIKDHPTKTLEDEKQCYFDYLIENASSHVTDYVNKKPVDYVFDIEAGCSPLHIACFMGKIDVVCCLLDHNANINITNEDGTTPLFFACEVGHEDIVCLLLDKGADTKICRLDSKSPLQIAIDNEHTSVVMIVTEHLKKKEKHSF